MKNYDETISSVFDRINEYKIKKRQRRKNAIRALVSLCFCFVFFIEFAIWQRDIFPLNQNAHNNSEQTINITTDLKWNINSDSFSRTSFISAISKDCKIKRISKRNFYNFLGITDSFINLPKNSKYYVVTKDSQIHSIRAEWKSKNGKVTIIIDPNNYPEFLFNEKCDTQTINGHLVAAHKSHFSGDFYEIDVGVKKDGVGVWIVGSSKTEAYINSLLNAVLYSEFNF